MALDFPSNPTNGQVYTDGTSGLRYVYNSNGGYWSSNGTSASIGDSLNTQLLFNDNGLVNGSIFLTFNKYSGTINAANILINGVPVIAGSASVNVGNTQPTDNTSGDLWWNTDLARLLVYYDDGDSVQWVDATPVGDVGPQGNSGNIEIGTTTTGAPLSLPIITNSGNGNFAVLNFTLPRPSNVVSNNTISVAPSQAPNVNSFYLANNDVGINFYSPRAPNVFVGATTTGAPGSISIVTPTTSSNGDVSLDFTIPRGNDTVTIFSDADSSERYMVFADSTSGTFSRANINTNFRFIASNGRLEVGGTINAANLLINNQPIVFDLTPANNWANTVAVVANTYARTILTANVAAANGWANVVAVVANNYATTILTANVAAANGWANTVAVVANTYARTILTANVAAGNGWANFIGVTANNYATTILTANIAAANGWANTKLSNATVTLQGTLTTTGSVIDSKADVRVIPTANVNATAYEITRNDVGETILLNCPVYIPNAIFTTGDVVNIYNNSAVALTITSNSSVTTYLAGTANSHTVRRLSQRGLATVVCLFANNFVISGGGVI